MFLASPTSRLLSTISSKMINLKSLVYFAMKSWEQWRLFIKSYFFSHFIVAIRLWTDYVEHRRMQFVYLLRSIVRQTWYNESTNWPFLHSLKNIKQAYGTAKWEFLAIAWFVFFSRPYLKDKRLSIQTNLNLLRRILNLPDATGKFVRLRLCLSNYDFRIVHRAGVKHQAANSPSGVPTDGTNSTLLED